MTYQGIDTAAKLTEEHANNAIRAKISFVGRYLVPATGTVAWKALTEDEANILRNAGLAILLCWELGASDIRYGGSKGSDHGIRARSLAEAMGVPYGTVIYFAADYDVPDYDLGMCGQYLKSAALTLGPYKIGVYGGEKIVKYCLDNHVCNYAWQCVAWTKNYHVNANVRQYAWQGDKRSKEIAAKIDTDPNFAVDLDSCEDIFQNSPGGSLLKMFFRGFFP